MRLIGAALCFLGLIGSSFASDFVSGENAEKEFALLNAWKSFKGQHSKSYESQEVEAYRYSIFVKNIEKANELNEKEGPNGAKFGMTKFMDLSVEEFREQYLGYRPNAKKSLERHHRRQQVMQPTEIVDAADTNVDWRLHGAVTPVKDQGQCGSCWAFSTVEEVESMWFMKHGKLPVLSPQQVVSCDTKGENQGCNGGDTVTAYDYVKAYGLETEAAYPYKAIDSACKYDANYVAANITGYTYATPACFDSCKKQDEKTLLNNLASYGPVSICVYASSWQFYTGGVLSSASSCPYAYNVLDHCVQLVGYQSASPDSYWIVRNSWNTNWGEKGYIYIKFGSNLCGVADEATFATSA